MNVLIESIQIHEFYGIDDTPNLKRNFWGFWSNATGLEVTEKYQWERRKDLTGVTIKATTTNVSSFADFNNIEHVIEVKNHLKNRFLYSIRTHQ